MRAPDFWWRARPSLLSSLLWPSSILYAAIAASRLRRQGATTTVPVICIGNFTAGGAGKTPTAIAVAKWLSQAGEVPAFLSRGYGGREAGPLRVAAYHSAGDVGDEPRLLARHGVAIVSRDRPAGARLAVERGATIIVMDDGLQNPSLRKDVAIAVVDGATGIGNGWTLPAGPLRAPLASQWPIVDAVVVIEPGSPGDRVSAESARQGKPVFRARLIPDSEILRHLRGKRVLAFAGIGRPEKFYTTLREAGVEVAVTRSFADHHAYSADDIESLIRQATDEGLVPVTTEKDLARIAGLTGLPEMAGLIALPVTLQVDDEAALRALVLSRIARRRTPST